MRATRMVAVACGLALLPALAGAAPADPAPAAPAVAPRGTDPPSGGTGALAFGSADSIPRILRIGTIGTIATPAPRSTIPIVLARGAVLGGTGLGDGASAYGGRANGLVRLGISPRVTLEGHTGLLALDRARPDERRLTRTGARLRYGDHARGAWLGAAFEQSLARGGEPSPIQLGLGAWAASGAVALAFSLEQTREYVQVATVLPGEMRVPNPLTDTSGVSQVLFDQRLVRATSALMSGRWEHGRLGIESVAGVTLHRLITPRRWMQASLDVALWPRLAAYATLGHAAPRWFSLEPGTERGATLGLRLTGEVNPAAAREEPGRPRPPEFRLRHLGEDWYVIEVRVRAAGPVEVIGDFSGWEPRALGHVTGKRWALAIRLLPGVHQIQVRVDGGPWSPPGGLPTASDGFNGDVGVFVAR